MGGVKGKTGVYKKSEEHNKNLSISLKGRVFSEEHKRKLREARKKQTINHSSETKEKIRMSNIGKKRSEETKIKLKKSRAKQVMKPRSPEYRRKMSEDRKGDKWYTWKGGITPINRAIRNSVEYKLWREAVFKRDNYICVFCKERGGELNADHIKSFAYYPELRFAINNGRTLCVSCHKTTDNYGGKCKNDKRTI
jgi:hypothetical protein